ARSTPSSKNSPYSRTSANSPAAAPRRSIAASACSRTWPKSQTNRHSRASGKRSSTAKLVIHFAFVVLSSDSEQELDSRLRGNDDGLACTSFRSRITASVRVQRRTVFSAQRDSDHAVRFAFVVAAGRVDVGVEQRRVCGAGAGAG